MNKALGKILMGVALIVAVIGVFFGIHYLENYEEYFYVQIDNDKISDIRSSDDMRYEYKLPGYDDQGKSKSVTFKTSRKLRDQAYLKLKIKVTGVNYWEEVQLDEIPAAAREQLEK